MTSQVNHINQHILRQKLYYSSKLDNLTSILSEVALELKRGWESLKLQIVITISKCS